jgi:AcrR family transcriptional regulator
MSRPPKYTREQIIEAAERVVTALGSSGLSFDAVAREAGVSKGAVLHYFGTKQALIAAMVERLVDRLAPQSGARSASPGLSDVGALIHRSQQADGAKDVAASALLAAVTQDLSALKPIRAANREHLDWLGATPIGSFAAQLLHFALDGLWISEVLGISPLSAKEREAFFGHLLEHFMSTERDVGSAMPNSSSQTRDGAENT